MGQSKVFWGCESKNSGVQHAIFKSVTKQIDSLNPAQRAVLNKASWFFTSSERNVKQRMIKAGKNIQDLESKLFLMPTLSPSPELWALHPAVTTDWDWGHAGYVPPSGASLWALPCLQTHRWHFGGISVSTAPPADTQMTFWGHPYDLCHQVSVKTNVCLWLWLRWCVESCKTKFLLFVYHEVFWSFRSCFLTSGYNFRCFSVAWYRQWRNSVENLWELAK